MAKYYRQKELIPVDYEKDCFSPCWTCENACGGCCWSRDFKPVPGWIAEKTIIESNGEHAESYNIISCPEYRKEKRG